MTAKLIAAAIMLGLAATPVAGASRSDGAPVRVDALSPAQPGLSANAQPNLYWRLSGAVSADARFALTVTNEDSFETVLETTLPGAYSAGVHRVSLRDYGVTLQAGVPYQWHVAIVLDSEQRSKDVVASAGVIHQPMAKAASGVTAAEKSTAFAAKGYWYDAIDTMRMAPRTDRIASLEDALPALRLANHSARLWRPRR